METIAINHVSWTRKCFPYIAIVCIVGAFVFGVVDLRPTNFFGYTEDDSIYFSSAKALAQGKGYVLASFPGNPAATKYPIFYPWLLSWVWRWNPSFPSNLNDAVAISIAFGSLYIFLAFLFFKQFKTLSQVEALILTAFCALHPLLLFYSGNVLSDIPFATFALAAMVLAERATSHSSTNQATVGCGLMVGLSILTRAFGVPVAAGIALTAVIRRAWRPLFVFCLTVIPFLTLLCWQTVFPHIPVSPASGQASSSLGWVHTWVYYTSYVGDWKQGVPNVSTFMSILKNNLILLVSTPATYLIGVPFDGGLLAAPFTVLVAALPIAGLQREHTIRPAEVVLPFYCCLVLFWNYGESFRFLIPFLPLIAAGTWLECKHVLAMVRTSMIRPRPFTEKLAATGLAAGVLLFSCALFWNYAGGVRTFTFELSNSRANLLQEKREVYRWLSRSTDPTTRVVAYEDAVAYLYTSHTAARPMTFPTIDLYDPAHLDRDTPHLPDVARAISAQYWITSQDDFDNEWSGVSQKGQAEMTKLERGLPLAYQSRGGHVRVYLLDCQHGFLNVPCQPEGELVGSDREPSGQSGLGKR